MQKLVWALVVLLVILHQDLWFWENDTLVFGFMPLGLFYHACLSVAASITWFLATRHCWPELNDGSDAEHEIKGPANSNEEAVA